MNIKANDARRPVSIVVIGAGNRANKYLEYAKINPDKVQLVGVVELNDIRRNKVAERFGLDASQCCSDYKTFFHNPVKSDAILICTPENMHFEPSMMAIRKGFHVLLEKPIARHWKNALPLARLQKKKGLSLQFAMYYDIIRIS